MHERGKLSVSISNSSTYKELHSTLGSPALERESGTLRSVCGLRLAPVPWWLVASQGFT